MGGPVINKVVTTPVKPSADQTGTSPAKVGESKFDKVRASLQDSQATEVKMPPEVRQVSTEQRKILQADLSDRLKTSSPQQIFGAHMQQATNSLQQLTTRVNALPKTSAFDPLRQRLASIDAQYHSAGSLVNSVKGNSNPAELMKIQMQMYQLTENLELASKVVEQVTSGVKSILQTQV
jgi:hypothetical protein